MTLSTTSRWFQNYDLRGEQRLMDNLVNEQVRIAGIDVFYVARDLENYNKVYGEDDQSSYSRSWMIAAYMKSVMGFTGDRDFMSKFAGLEIRDQVVFSITDRMFQDGIGFSTGFVRPREGDIIFFPINKRCYQIRYVDQYSLFFQLGKLYAWDCTCELFEYSSETFNTGIPDLDRMTKASLNVLDYSIKDTSGTPIMIGPDYWVVDNYVIETIDPNADNTDIDVEANNYIDFNVNDPFGES